MANKGKAPDISNGGMPTVEDLLAALENMPELSDENRKELKESILRGGLAGMAQEAENIAQTTTTQVSSSFSGEILLLFFLISLVFCILVFFGYKLYSSLMEKERRREEKRKQKQQKKKK